MRRALTLIAALGLACASFERPAWEQPPPPPRDAPVVDKAALTRATFPNGMGLIVLEDHRLPRVALGVAVRGGVALEGLDEAGLASFTTELMERGAGERDALELAAVVDGIGSSLSAGAGWDSSTVSVSGLSRDLDTLFEVLTDVVLRPRFDPREAERVRSETGAALSRALDNPQALAAIHTARALYPGHRYGLRAAGEPETVKGLDAAAARAFHRRLFVPGNAIFFANGDVDVDDLKARIEAAFGDWEPGPAPDPGPPPPSPAPPGRRVVIVNRPDLGQAQIRVAHDGLARHDERRVAASLASRVLGGGGFSSRLMSRVRADEGLTYGVSSYFDLRHQPGPFTVSTFTRVPEVRRVVDILLEEIGRMHTAPPGPEELGRFQSQATGRFALSLETSAAVTSSLVDLELSELPADSLDTYRGRVRAITPQRLAEVAREVFHPDRAAIVVVGPAEALRAQLADLGPLEVVQP